MANAGTRSRDRLTLNPKTQMLDQLNTEKDRTEFKLLLTSIYTGIILFAQSGKTPPANMVGEAERTAQEVINRLPPIK
jgi:hypothetical protein